MQRHLLLFDKLLSNDLTVLEREELIAWVQKSEKNFNSFKEHLKKYDIDTSVSSDAETAYQKFSNTIDEKQKKLIKRWQVYKYAAIFIGFVALSWATQQYFLVDSAPSSPHQTVSTQHSTNDKNQITITLGDGITKTIVAGIDGQVTDENGKVIANTSNGALNFDTSGEEAPKMNEVYIPFGQTFKIKLSDGTMVWLNAGSRLRFPQHFSNSPSSRMVFLEGEAYFDVTPNKHKPFIVHAADLDIKVLGTQFNVSAYPTDKDIKTTLVEGAVNVYETDMPEHGLKLRPSYQATYNKLDHQLNTAEVNTEVYTSWMQNKLIIDHLKFPEILKKLERMHNVTIHNKAEELNVEIYKGEFQNESIETILNTIAISTPFNYEINGNTVSITQ